MISRRSNLGDGREELSSFRSPSSLANHPWIKGKGRDGGHYRKDSCGRAEKTTPERKTKALESMTGEDSLPSLWFPGERRRLEKEGTRYSVGNRGRPRLVSGMGAFS